MKVRVYQLARELGISSREALELCAAAGIGVTSASSGLDEEGAEQIRRRMAGPGRSRASRSTIERRSTAPRLRSLNGGRVDRPGHVAAQGPRTTTLAVVDSPPTPAAPVVQAAPARSWTPPGATCVLCAARPAAAVAFRQCTGRGATMVIDEIEGPFCRDCGTAVFRDVTDETLTTGWWGVPAFFANWVVVVQNVLARRAVLALAPPDVAPAASGVVSRVPVGRPMARRRGSLVAAVMLGVLVAMLVGLAMVVRMVL